jgi:GNAT superfamily N-acetyltransferase
MTNDESPIRLVAGPDGRQAYDELSATYHRTLSAPLDDMWSAFADDAEPLAIVIGDGPAAGCASIDPEGDLHRFFVRNEFDDQVDRCFEALVEQRGVDTVVVATADPGLLSVAVPRCRSASTVALVYQHETAPEGGSLSDFRHAVEADHEAAVAFTGSATGAPEQWLEGYVAERIDRRELFLHEDHGQITGIGERRIDQRSPGHAHLGMIVGLSHRCQGLGLLLMNTLVGLCQRDALTPLCSTEPGNHAAQKVIRRAGFARGIGSSG